ncbi:MAG: histidine kinase [Rubrivivax sp.]|nr:histidine kinase [Rubrivivax sp.]
MQRLDQPLPAELAGSGHGWFNRYRRWPVFSPAWISGRTRIFGVVLAAALALLMLPLLALPLEDVPFGSLAQVVVQMAVPLLLGPRLAGWVRRQDLSVARETLALAGVMGTLVVAVLVFHDLGSEAMKQWIAERTGQVDERGQRKRMLMSIGVVVTSPDAAKAPETPASAPAGPMPLSPMARAMNGVSSAITTFLLAGGAGIWGLRRERAALASLARERELSRAQAERREAELKLSVLAAQVEPHFLFNTLAGVRSAIATDPARASEMIDRLVEYLRASIPRLRSSGESDATLGGQLDIVRAYLGLMSARMPRLHWDVRVPTELLALPCPPLMLISLAENAVKHGAEPKVGPVQIDIAARRDEDGRLEVTVADDGAGFGASVAGSGLGLVNIRERLHQMFQGRAALTLRARPEGGVVATLTVPAA